MGLDISYCRKARKISDRTADADAIYREQPDADLVYPNRDFPAHADGMDAGYYVGEDHGNAHAGSYSGYNRWRDMLCRKYHGVSAKEFWAAGSPAGAFSELINFSDCEGVIGPVVSKKLAADFAANEPINDGYDQWEKFKKAFEVASDGGYVLFR